MENVGSPSRERQPGRSRARRWLLRGSLALAVLLALAYGLRERWLGPALAQRLRQLARERYGAELSIARVTGGWFGDLAFEGVSWRATRAPLLRVEEARVELDYSLLGALRGAPELSVRVQGRGIELEPVAEAAPAGAGTGAGTTLPELPLVELELEDLALRRPGLPSVRVDSLRASATLAAREVRVRLAELAVGANRATLVDAMLELSELGWLESVRRAHAKLEVALPDVRALAYLVPGDARLESAALELVAEGGRARVTGHAELVDGRLEVERGELTWPSGATLAQLELDLGLRAELSDLSALGTLLGRPLAGRWSGAIDVRGPLRAPTGRFIGRGEELEVDGLALTTVDVDLQTDGTSARLLRCEATGPDFEAVLRGEVRLQPLELVDVALDLVAHESALALVLPVPCASAVVHARLSGPPAAPVGDFEASATGIQLGRFRIHDAEARGRLIGEGPGGARLEVAELRLLSDESSIEAAGTLRRTGADFTAELERLVLGLRDARAELERGGRITFGRGHVELDDLALVSRGEGAAGRATIGLRHADGETRAALEFQDYDAGPLLAPFAPPGLEAGRASGRVEGELGGAAPQLLLDLALTGWTLSPAWPPLDAVLRGAFDGRALALARVEVGFEAEERARARGTLRAPFDPLAPLQLGPGPVELQLALETKDAVRTLQRAGLEPGPSATGPCRFEADLAGEWRSLRGALTIAAEDVTLGAEAGARLSDLAAELELGEHVRVRRALFSAPSGTIELAGEVRVAPDLPNLLADHWALLEAPLMLDAKLDLADVSWLADLLPNLRRVSGQVAGRLAVTGTPQQPALDGALALREGELRLASLDFPVRSLAANLRFEGQTVQVVELAGEVGGAPLRATGTLEPFGPYPRLDLAVRGERLLLARDAHLLLRADLDLVVKGTPSLLSVRGELALAEGRYTSEISPLEELLKVRKRSQPARTERFVLWPEEPLASAELDVKIGGAPVGAAPLGEGSGANRTFEYRTNLLTATLRPDVRLRGTGAYPVLEGPVYLEEATLVLPSGKLALSSGVLTFRREAGLNADVAFTAEMRVQRHDIRLAATGTLSELEFVPSSSPPLPADDLWILIFTGQLPTDRWEDRSAQAMEALAVFLARDTLVRWFDAEPEDTEGLLERFEIDIGAQTSRSGQTTGRVLFYLRPLDRRSGRATYLSAEIDEYDRYNYALGIVFRPR